MEDYYKNGTLHPLKASIRFLKSCGKSGLKTAIATSSKKENAERIIERLTLGEHVEALSSGSMVKNAKTGSGYFFAGRPAFGCGRQ